MKNNKMLYSSDKFYEDLYTAEYEDTPEDKKETALRDKNIAGYRQKTIIAGDYLECEIYPVWNTRSAGQRARKEKASRKAQKNLNDKNAKKRLIRLVNNNFTKQDIWATFTYDEKNLPASPDLAKKDIQNYLRRLKHYYNKHYIPKNGGIPFKFVYVTEYNDDVKKGKKRVHHHLILNFPNRDIAESFWKGGAITQARRLQPNKYGLEGLSRYITKDPQGCKRYVCSKNLVEPEPIIAKRRMTKTKVRNIAENVNDAKEIFENIYKGYDFTDMAPPYYSDYASGVYIYVRMRRQTADKEVPPKK